MAADRETVRYELDVPRELMGRLEVEATAHGMSAGAYAMRRLEQDIDYLWEHGPGPGGPTDIPREVLDRHRAELAEEVDRILAGGGA